MCVLSRSMSVRRFINNSLRSTADESFTCRVPLSKCSAIVHLSTASPMASFQAALLVRHQDLCQGDFLAVSRRVFRSMLVLLFVSFRQGIRVNSPFDTLYRQ